MSYRRTSDAELAVFAKNIALKLSSHEIICFSPAVADQLAASLAPKAEELSEACSRCVKIVTQKQSEFSTKHDKRMAFLEEIADIYKQLMVAKGSEADFELCGLSQRRKRSTIVAREPSRLTATSSWESGNSLKFEGNNKYGDVIYQIWRRGDEGTWAQVGVTKMKTFLDKEAEPGKFYSYKVRAQASKNTSHFCDAAVVNKL